jgi:ceramide glucosyltransferase
MDIFAEACLLAVSFSVLAVYSLVTIFFHRGKNEPQKSLEEYPLVSVLKPVRDSDDDLERNFESFFQLDYPRYEILFAVDSREDEGNRIIRRLMLKYPSVPARIVVTGHSVFDNPKIHKLARLEPLSQGELFWVTDSNIQVKADTLSRLVQTYLQKGAKVVFSPILGTSSGSLGSLMENAGLNFFTSGNIIAAWALFRQPIIVGKSILIERESLSRFGGFSYFKNHLAEDFLLGDTFVKSGFPVESDYTWVTNINRTTSLKGFFERMSRWAKLRFHLKKGFYLLELVLNPMVVAIAGLLGSNRGRWMLLAIAVGLKIQLEYVNFLVLNAEDRKKIWAHLLFPVAVIVKDLLLFIIYLTPFFSRTVRWRKGKLSIGKKTLITLPGNLDNLVHDGA